MKALLLLLLLWGIASTHALEYIIITDPGVISPQEAISKLDEGELVTALRGGNSKRGNKKRPKLSRTIRKESASAQNQPQELGLLDDLDEEDLATLQALPGVQRVVLNAEIWVSDLESAAAAETATTQWNLDRIDQAFGLDNTYKAAKETGVNVDIYIVDTGVVNTHVAFGDRVLPGMSSVMTAPNAFQDCVGHGTHVASTAAGVGFGVATGATIIPVQIIDCSGKGTLFTMQEGVFWVLQQMKQRKRRSIINLSIEASANEDIDALVRDLQDAGGIVVSAAANKNSDACKYSPARESRGLTVSATTPSDTKLASSNFGPCVDLYAPGAQIVGAGIYTPTATATKQGTSMATPLVAGVAATIWERFPAYTNDQIVQVLLLKLATEISIDCHSSERVKFLQSLSTSGAQQRPIGSGSRGQNLSIMAKGSQLRGDFLTWSPKMTVQPSSISSNVGGAAEGQEICFSFQARVVDSLRYGPELASFRLAISSAAIPSGLAGLDDTCSNAPKYYVFEDAPAYSMISSATEYDMASEPRLAGALPPLSNQYATDYYVLLRQASSSSTSGISIEFGKGNGMDDRNRDALVSVVDDSLDPASSPLSTLKYISFTAPTMYNLEFTNLQSCSALPPPASDDEDVVQPPSPTNAPGDTSGGTGQVESVPRLEVSAAQRKEFFLWPSAWAKPELNLGSCLAFTVPDIGNLKGTIVLGVASQPLGVVPVGGGNTQLAADLFEVHLTKTTTSLMLNGKLLVSGKNVVKLNKKAATLLRVTQLHNTLQVDVQVKKRWQRVYSFGGLPAQVQTINTRFALASFQPRIFSKIQVC